MPTFDDPMKDAAEASAALRGLAHASRAFDDPADTYAVIGELLAGVRSLRQVLGQLAETHVAASGQARTDEGDPLIGRAFAYAAADMLREAGTVLDTVEFRLDTASQHSGRIAWHPKAPPDPGGSGPERTTARAGQLTLTVWADTPLGEHQRYAYRIEDAATGEAVEGRDLFTGAGAPVAPERAVRELAGFLSAAGEARQYAIDNPGTSPENAGLFPERIAEAARVNADALSELAEPGPQPPDAPDAAEPAAGRRWISVVFLDGGEGDRMLDLIHASGTDAAIEHLAGYDHGEDTVRDALANGYVYDNPPRGALDRAATKDVYTLTYSPFLGRVSLLREYDAVPDPELLGIDTPAPAARRAERRAASASQPETTDWYARAPRTASPGRGVAL
ncbi:hypothetical protein IT882_05440 [Microbacterium schleiferi]|uniref:Uncharacterized protein n=1 Tax=Microbacterium schleiferi TaxID=69362 RepID=A0A7S8MZK5_9MICO|nr:hypothetical protein [Microbacterium schleiferi]QPE05470.1 hypothetical protein IT882_05440 [Microbacterium schleiferi]